MELTQEQRKKRVAEILGLVSWACDKKISDNSDNADPYLLILSSIQDVHKLQHPDNPMRIGVAFNENISSVKMAKEIIQ